MMNKINASGKLLIFMSAGLTALTGCVHSPVAPPVAEMSPHTNPNELRGVVLSPTTLHSTMPSTVHVVRMGIFQAIDTGLKNSLQMAEAQNQEAMARVQLLKQRLRWLPQLTAGALVGQRDGQIQGSFGTVQTENYHRYIGGFSAAAQWNIPGLILKNVAAARHVEASLWQTQDRKRRLILEIAALYYQLVVSLVEIEVFNQRLETSHQLVAITRAKHRGGLALVSYKARAEANLAANQQRLAAAKDRAQQISLTLGVLLHLPADTRIEPTLKELSLLPIDALQAVAKVPSIQTRPDLMASKKTAESRQYEVYQSWMQLFIPNLEARIDRLMVGADFNSMKGLTDWQTMLNWTISTDKITNIIERQTAEKGARIAHAQKRERAAAELAQSKIRIQTLTANLPRVQTELDAAQKTRAASLAQFKGGTAIVLEVLDAEVTLARARMRMAQTIAAYNLEQLRLLAVVGTLSESTLKAVKAAQLSATPHQK